jgi:hypothetical protein
LSLSFFNWATRHEGVLGEWRYSATHSLTSALDGGEWSASRPGRFTPREGAPVTRWIGGWVLLLTWSAYASNNMYTNCRYCTCVLATLESKFELFCVVTPCSVAVGYRRFGGPCCLHLQGEDREHVTTHKNYSLLSLKFEVRRLVGSSLKTLYQLYRLCSIEWENSSQGRGGKRQRFILQHCGLRAANRTRDLWNTKQKFWPLHPDGQ